jgi:hypothetical protein
MHVVENSIVIDKPATAVFEYTSDMRSEADWNPAASSVTLVSQAPVGQGSRFEARWKGLGSSELEVVDYERPRTWTTRTTRAALPFRLVGTVVELDRARSRLTMRIELLPTGLLGLLAPLIRLSMQPTAKGNLRRIKAAVEALPG